MLSVEEFGRQLIETRDLDPVYVGLVGMPHDQLRRWLLAYWCFYHPGVASYISEHEDHSFWFEMNRAAINADPSPLGGRWPRMPERRHFRGKKCVKAIEMFACQTPEYWVSSLEDYTTQQEVMWVVESWPMFGQWISFKAADMLEVTMGLPIKFSLDIPLIYTEPRRSLETLAKERNTSEWEMIIHLMAVVTPHREPAAGRRTCGVQEVETVLCKHKSHRAGRYEVGRDTLEVLHALEGWGETAERMRRAVAS